MKFFSRKQQDKTLDVTFEEQLAQQQVAPGTQLHYDSRLTERLRGHATALLELLARSGSAARSAKFDEAGKCLQGFRRMFNEHLLDKNLRLYTYLGCCLKADQENLETLREMRRETGEISRQAMRFLGHCDERGIDEDNLKSFLDELAQIEDLLSHRFKREERSLYPMYQPPHAYQTSPARPNSSIKQARAEAGYGLPRQVQQRAAG